MWLGAAILVQLLSPLPSGVLSRAMQVDAAGNIYLAGSVGTDAFVAKLSADASKVLYFTTLAGSGSEDAAGIVLGPDGSAYVAGSTGSNDFPVTAGAYQTTFNPRGASQGFLAKVDSQGKVVYASYINGTSFTTVTGIALGKGGEVFLTGSGGPAYPVNSGQPQQGFILKLDAAMTNVLLSEYGYGGGLITVDGQGNLYIAGTAQPTSANAPYMLPALPSGAFQTTHAGAFCQVAGGGPSPGFAKFCQYQLVAKLDAAAKLVWGTYVTGTYGAIPAGMAIDSAGNVIVAGTTNSSDYPVTPGAFQTAYTAAAAHLPPPPGISGPPNSLGYVTKVNATGTGLAWSTYFGGSSQDQITGMAVAPSGEIVVSGRASSNDLVFADTPEGCRPSVNQVLGFVGRLAADGGSAAATQPITGVPDCTYLGCLLGGGGLGMYQSGWPVALRTDGTAVVAGANGVAASVDFARGNRVACVMDPADNLQVNSVAPGQLLAIFGADLGPAIPSTSADGLGVSFNGIPAPILYASAQQINVQVPYEIAGASSVQMQVVNQKLTNPVSETRTLGVVERQPAVYLSAAAWGSPIPGYSVCGGKVALGQAAVALNADGTLNDCTNPATVGSLVTVFLNGMGVTTPALATGAVATAVDLTPPLDAGPFTGTTTIATKTVPGAITGVAQVQLRVGGATVLLNGASVAGVGTRERLILVWTK